MTHSPGFSIRGDRLVVTVSLSASRHIFPRTEYED